MEVSTQGGFLGSLTSISPAASMLSVQESTLSANSLETTPPKFPIGTQRPFDCYSSQAPTDCSVIPQTHTANYQATAFSSGTGNEGIKENVGVMTRYNHLTGLAYPSVSGELKSCYDHRLSLTHAQSQNTRYGDQGNFWNNTTLDFRSIYKPTTHKPKKPRAKPKCPVKRQNQRSAANVRERTRMKTINEAFLELKERIPLACKDRKVSKVDTLRLAIRYIHHLHDAVTEIDHVMGPNFTSGYQQVYPGGHQYRQPTPYIEGMSSDASGITYW